MLKNDIWRILLLKIGLAVSQKSRETPKVRDFSHTLLRFFVKSILTLIYVLLIFQTVEEGNDEEFEDMMDQLLERDAAGAPAEILAEAIEQHMGGHDSTLDDTHHDSAVS